MSASVAPEHDFTGLVDLIVERVKELMASSPEPILVGPAEAQRMLNMGETNFAKEYRSGRIKVFRNGRNVLFSVEELKEYARRNLTTY